MPRISQFYQGNVIAIFATAHVESKSNCEIKFGIPITEKY